MYDTPILREYPILEGFSRILVFVRIWRFQENTSIWMIIGFCKIEDNTYSILFDKMCVLMCVHVQMMMRQ